MPVGEVMPDSVLSYDLLLEDGYLRQLVARVNGQLSVKDFKNSVARGCLRSALRPEASSSPPFQRVYSVGRDPIQAIRALGKDLAWGKLDHFELQEDAPIGMWFYTFTAAGDSMKASGWIMPGGVTLTWWK